VGGSAAITHAAVPADSPPTPDPSPPLCGGRGEEKCAGPREMESALSRPAMPLVAEQMDLVAAGGLRIIERDVGFRE
jgi:hypothetical protein